MYTRRGANSYSASVSQECWCGCRTPFLSRLSERFFFFFHFKYLIRIKFIYIFQNFFVLHFPSNFSYPSISFFFTTTLFARTVHFSTSFSPFFFFLLVRFFRIKIVFFFLFSEIPMLRPAAKRSRSTSYNTPL